MLGYVVGDDVMAVRGTTDATSFSYGTASRPLMVSISYSTSNQAWWIAITKQRRENLPGTSDNMEEGGSW
jgi:hypothetical protein